VSIELNRRSVVRTALKPNKQEKEIIEWSADRIEMGGGGGKKMCNFALFTFGRRREGGYKYDLEQNS
jgi:hypothetical protein